MLIILVVPGQSELSIRTLTSYLATYTRTICEEGLAHIIDYLDKKGASIVHSKCIIPSSVGSGV